MVLHIIASNVEQHIALIVHSVVRLAITLDSRALNSMQTNIHADESYFFFLDIEMSKIFSTFKVKNHEMFSTKALLKQSLQSIVIRDNFQYSTIKSNKQVFILQCVFEECLWLVRASCFFYSDRSL